MKARVFDDAERPFRALKERVERNEAEGQRDETGAERPVGGQTHRLENQRFGRIGT